jgi:hypothetical protein
MISVRFTVEERATDVGVFVDLGVTRPANDQEWAFLSGVIDNFLARARKVEAGSSKPIVLSASQEWFLDKIRELDKGPRPKPGSS